MSRPGPISPVVAGVEVVRPPATGAEGRTSAATAVAVTADEPVLPGHYPGFPIFPGVCVIESVRLSALAAPPPGVGALALAGVETARFLSPVFPGDELAVELEWREVAEGWRCTAEVATGRAVAARTRLRFTDARPPAAEVQAAEPHVTEGEGAR
ncbi:3-hydroxyacyl-ACP dehydratase FabZ family protein [Kitasatospora hibisci]|uniref:3-hydroxyacyl-ACP dehydratase FabZ family protein n=1 Tax=Kitasatospora hibisci TaxID=3369522 RepID=UPI003754DF4D